MKCMTKQQPPRDLKLMRLLIDVVGGERHTVTPGQVRAWLDRMVGQPVATKSGVVQLAKQGHGDEAIFWLHGPPIRGRTT
jgi:hypothetical protein